MSGMDGARAERRRDAWRKIAYQCPCGRTVYGNGKTHQRSCRTHLATLGYPLDQGLQDAIREQARADATVRRHVVGGVEARLGQLVLAEPGLCTRMRWVEFRDLVWRLYAEET